MSARTIAASAAREAERLLAEHHPGGTPPVPVELIAQALGYRILHNHHDGPQISFYLQDATGRPHIGVNTAMSRGRQRFAATHALGHGRLHPRDLIICTGLRTDEDPPGSVHATTAEEDAATRFAFDLLMPARLVIEHAGEILAQETQGFAGKSQRDRLVFEMARRFGVSWEAVRYRLVDLAVIVP